MMKLVILIVILISIINNSNSIKISNKNIKISHLSSFLGLGLGLGLVPIQQSDATTYPGTVTISEKATPSTGALYITVRSDVGLWEAGVRNYKPPAVMVKKIPIDNVDVFPLKVELDDNNDITEEGKADNKWKSGKKPLLYSARLDDDANANTRSPADLVGQQANIKYVDGKWQNFEIQLDGRGGLGKAIVSKK